jgi:hypothetical protein
LFAEMVRSGKIAGNDKIHNLGEPEPNNEKPNTEIKINRYFR